MVSELENWNLEKWLNNLDLHKYTQAFIDNGYDTADLCANLHKEDLDAIGVHNKISRGTLFMQSKKLLELFNKEGLIASEEVVDKQSPQSPKEAKKNNTSSAPVKNTGGDQPLPGYSEPWNKNSPPRNSAPVSALFLDTGTQPILDTSKTSKTSFLASSPAGETIGDSVQSPAHRKSSGARRKPLVSPASKLPPFKNSWLSGPQLKLKIWELFTRGGGVPTEIPCCREVRRKD